MEFFIPDPEHLTLGLRTLATVARVDGPLRDGEAAVLRAADALLGDGSGRDLDLLEPIAPAELAAGFTPPPLRFQLVAAMLVMAMADGEVGQAEADLVAAFAAALGVESSAVHNLDRLARGHYRRARLDIVRRQWAPKKIAEMAAVQGRAIIPKAILGMLGLHQDPVLTARYLALGRLPAGSLGRSYFEYMVANEFAFPGEAYAPPEAMVFHDMTHILSGYGTTPDQEILAAAFSAGYSSYEVHNWFAFVLSQFQLGLQTAPNIPPARLQMDPARLLVAVRRGAAMTIDINDGWDYWEVIEEPVEALRERYHILPESAFMRTATP
ncbi:TerB family tellurite resistance protein [Nannocystis sp. ILAH1]|uniref:TerB family tellurite resistance protein n=1 Tax=Nannocystis sp. ILAH1 TaxID=2996789 RepID=UPI002270FFE1|nr:TerB family tellurite resistance protein [Nannocystis sp. ILAH1]MCY0994216.1 TerB family tellurite resistance protein [Nannocystis sp. ILAH1]